ncbi:AAA family ATPase [Kiloniella sp.]|uniref:AAA family ATPase n=1 Tax=Kiloniella sp. TaxID=1938587 RepID=UPI003A9321B6
MKLSYSVKNLRRLSGSKSVEIRPITILLGRNSVGKSTFLRSFPLLRQSIETKSSAPILWYGDYVDFGNFESAVKNQDIDKVIEFSFEIKESEVIYRQDQFDRRPRFFRGSRIQSYYFDDANITYGLSSHIRNTVRKFIKIYVPQFGSLLKIDFDKTGAEVQRILIDNLDIQEVFPDIKLRFSSSDLFGYPDFTIKDVHEKREIYRPFPFQYYVRQKLRKLLREDVGMRVGDETLNEEVNRILKHKQIDNSSLDSLKLAKTQTFKKFYERLLNGKRENLKGVLNNVCKATYFFKLFEAVSISLSQHFSAVEYIGPARARSERYYRQQELEISDISLDGKNLPMFLASLTSTRQDNFSEWVKKIFGYGVKVHKTEGHISINLEQDDQFINVVDTGYGVSQVLPVLAQIWWMRRENRGSRSQRSRYEARRDNGIKTLAIEQPELHLHPAHQALLADVFVESLTYKSGSDREFEQHFLVETHSEALINRLGELIEDGDVDAKHVQILIFGETNEGQSSEEIVEAEFNEKGVLKNWPFGFFNYV